MSIMAVGAERAARGKVKRENAPKPPKGDVKAPFVSKRGKGKEEKSKAVGMESLSVATEYTPKLVEAGLHGCRSHH